MDENGLRVTFADRQQERWERIQRNSGLLTSVLTASVAAGLVLWVPLTLSLAKTALFDRGEYMADLGLLVGGIMWVALALWTLPHLALAARVGDDLEAARGRNARWVGAAAGAGLVLVGFLLPGVNAIAGPLVLGVLVVEAVLVVQRSVVRDSRSRPTARPTR